MNKELNNFNIPGSRGFTVEWQRCYRLVYAQYRFYLSPAGKYESSYWVPQMIVKKKNSKLPQSTKWRFCPVLYNLFASMTEMIDHFECRLRCSFEQYNERLPFKTIRSVAVNLLRQSRTTSTLLPFTSLKFALGSWLISFNIWDGTVRYFQLWGIELPW